MDITPIKITISMFNWMRRSLQVPFSKVDAEFLGYRATGPSPFQFLLPKPLNRT